MGGVATDDCGRTSLEGLWACGEVAATGVHGANRLASNSLLEGMVFGHRVADDIAAQSVPAPRDLDISVPAVPVTDSAAEIAGLTARLRVLMYEKVGLRRDGEGLDTALSAHGELAEEISEIDRDANLMTPTLAEVRRWGELRNLALAGRLITLAAAQRCESRGAHYRIDFPQPEAATGVRQFLTLDDLQQRAGAQESHRDDTNPATALSA
jgi:L-aspartate oxidase